MITFTDEELLSLTQKRRSYAKLNLIFFAVCAVAAIITATVSATVEYGALPLSLFIIAGVMIICFIVFNFTLVRRSNENLKLAVAKRLAESFKNAKPFEADGEILIKVGYANDAVSVDCGKTTLDFDISPFKKLPVIYSSFGTLIWQYLKAYFTVNKQRFKEVEVCDETGSRPLNLKIISGDELQKPEEKNYFIKKELL